MAAPPYMPLYVADYLADAAHLSTLAHGAYLLLLMTYWQRGKALPDDDRKLAKIARLSDEEWLALRPDVAEFFQAIDGQWWHKRVEGELESLRSKSLKAQAAGRTSAERRSQTRAVPAGERVTVSPAAAERPANQRVDRVERPLNECSTVVERTPNHTDTDAETDKKVVVVEAGARAALERFTVADGDRVADRLFLDVVPEGHALRTDPLAASVCIGWLRSNFDVERDIVPAVRKALAGSYPITKWRSLTTWVERVFADRLAAESARPPPVLVEQPATVIHPSQSGHRHGKSSVQDIAKLAHERALAAAAGDGEILPPPRRQPH